MFGCRQFAVVAAIAWGATAAAAEQRPSAVGVWSADEGRTRVRIAPCGDKLCGTITWLKDPNGPHGKPLTDVENPDAALRGRPIVGLQILKGLVEDDSGSGQWEGGTIYDPQSGKTYECTLTLEGPDRLRLHGYIGVAIFGRTEVWTRVLS
jgi:uncharacterized protein (DUF2147 family)